MFLYFYLFDFFYIQNILTEQREKELSFNLRVIQRISALTRCVTVNPEQVSHDVMNSLRAVNIFAIFNFSFWYLVRYFKAGNF